MAKPKVRHQSAKVLGVVVSLEGIALAGKEETDRKTKRAARGRNSEKAGFIFSKVCFLISMHLSPLRRI
jgi:hypothetical protein